MSNLKALFAERNKRQQTVASKVSDTEALVKKMSTLESNLRSLQKERDDWKNKFDTFSGDMTKKDIREKILAIAASKNAVDPEDILYRFESKVKQNADKLVMDGSEKTLDEDIESFLASKPHLIKAPPVEARSGGASPFPASQKSDKTVDIKTTDGATSYARSFMPPGAQTYKP
jgi:hypothetical protein